MSPRSELILNIKASLESFQASLEGIGEEDARKVPEPGKWCVLECVEHLTLAEHGMLQRLKNGAPLAEAIHLPEREARMAAGVAGRATRVEAPPHVHPTGRYATLADARDMFTSARQRTIAFVETDVDLRAVQVTHPFFGDISGHELAMIMASHAVRHALQIREIREAIV